MEVIDKENPKSWTSFVNKLRKTKIRHKNHSKSDEDLSQEENIIYENDKPILEEQPIIDANDKTIHEEKLRIDENDSTILEEQQRIDENDKNFLDQQSKIFQKLGFTSDEKPKDEDEQKRKIEEIKENSSIFENNNDPGESKPIVSTKKIGRNDPCDCGSGKKYKHCCGKVT